MTLSARKDCPHCGATFPHATFPHGLMVRFFDDSEPEERHTYLNCCPRCGTLLQYALVAGRAGLHTFRLVKEEQP